MATHNHQNGARAEAIQARTVTQPEYCRAAFAERFGCLYINRGLRRG